MKKDLEITPCSYNKKMNTISALVWAILTLLFIYYVGTGLSNFIRHQFILRRIKREPPFDTDHFRDCIVGIASKGQKILDKKGDYRHAIFDLRDEVSLDLYGALINLYSNREKIPQVGDVLKDDWLKRSSIIVMLLAMRFNRLGGKKINIFGLPSFSEIQTLANGLDLNIDDALENDEKFISVCALLFESITRSIPDFE